MMKSTWRHRFWAFAVVDAQYWARTIQRRIRKGLHPFPNKNRTSLKASWFPGSFFQNMSLISLGHDFKEGDASPSIAFKSLFLSSPISCPHNSRTSSRYNCTDALSANKHWWFRMSLYSRHTTAYTSCHANNNKLHFFVVHSSSFACNLFISKFVTLS